MKYLNVFFPSNSEIPRLKKGKGKVSMFVICVLYSLWKKGTQKYISRFLFLLDFISRLCELLEGFKRLKKCNERGKKTSEMGHNHEQ